MPAYLLDEKWEQIKQFPEYSSEKKKKEYPIEKIKIGKNFLKALYTKIGDTLVYQPPVLNQFRPKAGGKADCGYHLLKNAYWVCYAQKYKIISLESNLQELLPTTALFSEWKVWVTNLRRKKEFKELLKPIFQGAVRPESDVKDWKVSVEYTRELFRNLMGLLAKKAAELFLHDDKVIKPKEFIVKGLQELLKFKKKKLKEDLRKYNFPSSDLVKYYTSPGGIDLDVTEKYDKKEGDNFIFGVLDFYISDLYDHFSEKKIIEKFINFDALKKLDSILKKAKKKKIRSDWLKEDDMKEIVRNWEFENTVLAVYDTLDLLGMTVDGNKSDLESAAKKIAQGKKINVLFAVGTMERDGDTGTRGHWFSLVRLYDGRYVVMDSGENTIRLNYPRVKKLITYFEGLVKKFKEEG